MDLAETSFSTGFSASSYNPIRSIPIYTGSRKGTTSVVPKNKFVGLGLQPLMCGPLRGINEQPSDRACRLLPTSKRSVISAEVFPPRGDTQRRNLPFEFARNLTCQSSLHLSLLLPLTCLKQQLASARGQAAKKRTGFGP